MRVLTELLDSAQSNLKEYTHTLEASGRSTTYLDAWVDVPLNQARALVARLAGE